MSDSAAAALAALSERASAHLGDDPAEGVPAGGPSLDAILERSRAEAEAAVQSALARADEMTAAHEAAWSRPVPQPPADAEVIDHPRWREQQAAAAALPPAEWNEVWSSVAELADDQTWATDRPFSWGNPMTAEAWAGGRDADQAAVDEWSGVAPRPDHAGENNGYAVPEPAPEHRAAGPLNGHAFEESGALNGHVVEESGALNGHVVEESGALNGHVVDEYVVEVEHRGQPVGLHTDEADEEVVVDLTAEPAGRPAAMWDTGSVWTGFAGNEGPAPDSGSGQSSVFDPASFAGEPVPTAVRDVADASEEPPKSGADPAHITLVLDTASFAESFATAIAPVLAERQSVVVTPTPVGTPPPGYRAPAAKKSFWANAWHPDVLLSALAMVIVLVVLLAFVT